MSSVLESRRPRGPVYFLGIVLLALLTWWCWRAREGSPRSALPPPPQAQAERSPARELESAESARVEQPAPAAGPQVEPEPPAAIPVTGRVLDDATDAPLPGARIVLQDPVWKPGTHESRLTSETTSAQDGTFTTDAVPNSQYRLRVSLADYATEQVRIDVPERSRSLVTEGQRFYAGDVRLRRGFHARFRVVDALTQAPIAGASLYLFEGSEVGSLEYKRFLGVTDEHGSREVAERILVRGPDSTLLALTDDGMATMSLSSGDRLAPEREFVVPIGGCSDFLARVRDESGAALEGATVTVCPRMYPMGPLVFAESILDLSGTGGDDGRLKARFRKKTDSNGAALLHGFPRVGDPSGYELWPSLQGYEGKRSPPVQPGPDPQVPTELVLTRRPQLSRVEGTVQTADGSRLSPIRVHCGGRTTTADPSNGHYELAEFDFSSPHSGWLQATAPGWASEPTTPLPGKDGKCTQDLTLLRVGSIRGLVVDESGRPAGGVRLWLEHNNEKDRRAPIRTLTGAPVTLTDGAFEFSDLPNGEYAIRAFLETVPSNTSPQLRFPIVLASTGETRVRIEGWRDSSTKGRVHATVLGARTRAAIDIAAAWLGARTESFGTRWSAPAASYVLRVGEVEIPSVATGRWSLWVLATDGSIGFADFETTDTSPSAEVEVRVADDAVLSGKLVAAPGATPPASWDGWLVLAVRHVDWVTPGGGIWGQRFDRYPRTTARPDGSFEFTRLVPGQYTLQASDKVLHGMLEVDFTDARSKTVEFVLQPPAFAAIAIEAPIELFDGLTMLHYWERGQLLDDFPLKADVPGQNRRTIRVEPGSFRIQASRKANARDKSEPKSFLLDESFELKADETRTLAIPAPR